MATGYAGAVAAGTWVLLPVYGTPAAFADDATYLGTYALLLTAGFWMARGSQVTLTALALVAVLGLSFRSPTSDSSRRTASASQHSP